MSIKKEPSGRRSVQVEVEVKGTPEQVWQAIATGPGISSWFVPTQVDGRVGGTLTCDFGGGMVSATKITNWQPPLRFTAEGSEWLQGGPPVATEWIVESKAGGTCIVRVVHSLFASTDQWDDQIESTEQGWPSFFRVLRLYLERHAGERSATIQLMAMGKDSTKATWDVVLRALGTPQPRKGQRVQVQPSGAAAITATVESVDESDHGYGMLLHANAPVPGAILAGSVACMGMLMATLQIYLYGDRAAAVAADGARWQEWFGGLFPAQAAPPLPAAGESS
jgi:uncharacterized protein YndB with AHSA1/START domain